jgi:hypothetical protein
LQGFFGASQVFVRTLDALANALAAAGQVVQVYDTRFIRIPEPAQGLFLSAQEPSGLVSLLTQGGHRAIAGTSARPLVEHMFRIL